MSLHGLQQGYLYFTLPYFLLTNPFEVTIHRTSEAVGVPHADRVLRVVEP
jgi:hypothetical protein